MRRRPTRLAAAIFFAIALVPARAFAQDPSESAGARALARDAKEAFDAGDWTKALDLYHRAGELVSAPTLVLREARCLAKLGRLVEASELMVKVTRWQVDDNSPTAFQGAVQEAAAELADLRKRIPSLKLSAPETGTDLRFDDGPVVHALLNVYRPVDPGVHTISGIVGGKQARPERVELAEGARLEVLIRPADAGGSGFDRSSNTTDRNGEASPDGSRTGSTQRLLGWTAVGVGAVGLGVGVATGLVASGKHSDLESACPNNRCPSSAGSDIDSFRSMRTVSTISYGVGGIAVAGGAVLLLTSPRAAVHTAHVSPWVGLGSAGLRGAF